MEEINSNIERLLYQLAQEGLLDDQFQQLMQLQDESNPDFVKEVVELYFQDSGTKLENLTAKLADERPDYGEIDALVHQFKGSSASFGAQAIAQMCVQLREACHRQDREACKALLDQIKQNYTLLNSKLEVFMSLEQRGKQLLAS